MRKVLTKPNFMPDVVSIALLGPGVKHCKMKVDKAENKVKVIINIFL